MPKYIIMGTALQVEHPACWVILFRSDSALETGDELARLYEDYAPQNIMVVQPCQIFEEMAGFYAERDSR